MSDFKLEFVKFTSDIYLASYAGISFRLEREYEYINRRRKITQWNVCVDGKLMSRAPSFMRAIQESESILDSKLKARQNE